MTSFDVETCYYSGVTGKQEGPGQQPRIAAGVFAGIHLNRQMPKLTAFSHGRGHPHTEITVRMLRYLCVAI